MFALITDAANGTLLNLAQIILGLLISLIFLMALRKPAKNTNSSLPAGMLFIALFSLLGSLLPLGIYGLIPIVAVLFLQGIRVSSIIPLIVSSSLFNMLVPYTEVGFIWRNSIPRIIFALTAGILAGVLTRLLKGENAALFRENTLKRLTPANLKKQKLFSFITEYTNVLGPYLLLGVIADSIFRRYFFMDILRFMNTSSIFPVVGTTLLSHNATTNQFFSLAMITVTSLMDLLKWTAFCSILRFKGILRYLAYLIFLCIIMTALIFI
ncbi:MAG: hypothetical protein Q8930_18720 [Bacillota bacterium]|nr:hypothetical protein [Bacillota bacterium]